MHTAAPAQDLSRRQINNCRGTHTDRSGLIDQD